MSAADQLVPGTALEEKGISDPAEAAMHASAAPSLQPYVTLHGRISVSTDAVGYITDSDTIKVRKPPGSKVRKAYLAASTIWGTSTPLADGDVKVNGKNVNWSTVIANDISSNNHWADVTSIVKPLVDAAPAGIVNVPVSEVYTSITDGEILIVIFDDPNVRTDNSVILLFGAQKMAGDTFWISLSQPYNPTTTKNVTMSLGVTYSYQSSSVFQYSIIDVNKQRLTSWAGGQDDSIPNPSANGALITVGGIDDSINNPPDPYNSTAGDFRYDDELYDLKPFLTKGTQLINVTTKNPSNDDNIMFASFFLEGNTAIVGEGIILTPSSTTRRVGSQHSVRAYVQNDLGAPVPNRWVNFSITSGPNKPRKWKGVTDSAGIVFFNYTGMSAGTDRIIANMIDSQGEVATSNTVSCIWTASRQDKIGIFRNGIWQLDYNGNGIWDGATIDRQFSFGTTGDKAAPGDWSGSGKTAIGYLRYGSAWYLDYNANGMWNGSVIDRLYRFGVDDTPVEGDWNGDGKAEIGIFRNGIWYLDYNGNGQWDGQAIDRKRSFGILGDKPVAGNWNGDTRTEIGIFRGNGIWQLDYNGNGIWNGTVIDRQYKFGQTRDIPVAGNWNSDTRTEIGIFRGNGVWQLDYNGNGIWNGTTVDRQYTFGKTGDQPVVGKW